MFPEKKSLRCVQNFWNVSERRQFFKEIKIGIITYERKMEGGKGNEMVCCRWR